MSETLTPPQVASHEQQLAAMMRAFLEVAPSAILCVDRQDCHPLWANQLACELLGQQLVSEAGQKWARTYVLEHQDGTPYEVENLPIRRVLSTGQRIHTDDIFIRRADGSRIRVEVTAVPVYWSQDHHFDAVMAVFQDITERTASGTSPPSGQQWWSAAEQQWIWEEKMRSMATLAGGVAHDFNNILVSVLGNASLIQSEMPKDHQWFGPISSILSSAERAAGITRQLLAYARGTKFAPRLLSLRAVVADCLQLCRSVVPKNVTIEFDARTSDDQVEVDPAQMQQIMLILIMNASEAMPEGGPVRITTAPCTGPQDSVLAGDPCVCLHVKDEGCGISAENSGKIFEPFFTTKQFGRGLGLASTYGMLQNHGAEIRLVSQPGEGGAEFSIYLPLKKR